MFDVDEVKKADWQAAYENADALIADDDPFAAAGYVGNPLAENPYELVYEIVGEPGRHELTVVGYRGAPVDVEIFEPWNGMPVTRVADGAFLRCETLRTVALGSDVVEVGPSAFAYCDALESVALSESMTYVPQGMCQYCDALSDVYIPEGVESIGGFAFCCCDSLARVDLPPSVSVIECDAFCRCASLNDIDLSWVDEIGDTAFEGCGSLEEVRLGINGRAELGWSAFSDCTALARVEFGGHAAAVGTWAFSGCTSLRAVSFSYGIETIERGAFARCTAIEELEFPETLRYIEPDAFAGCSALRHADVLVEDRYDDDWYWYSVFDDRLDVDVDKTAFDDCPLLTFEPMTSHGRG